VHGTALAVGLAQGALLVPLYMLMVPFVYGEGGARADALLVAPLIPAYIIGAYSASVLMGRLRIGAFNVIRLAVPLLYCAGVLALARSDALTPRTGALTFVAGHAVIDALAVALALRVAGVRWPERATARSLFSYGVRAQGGRMSAQALGVETLIVAIVLTSHDLGLFVAATAVLMAPQMLMSSMSVVVFPHVSATHQSGERADLNAAFAAYATAIVVVTIGVLTFAGTAIDVLFGAEFAGAAPALRMLAIATLARCVRQFPLEVLRGVGRPGLTSIAEGANWLLVLTAVPAGAAIGGLQGAAAGVIVVSYGSLAVLTALMMRAGVVPSFARRARRIEAAEAAA
jgi:O-antigen/teichoic acid export membrane protein